ncbi:hypothetical protein Bca52824_009671 [Brassica carinata]|uniref:TF-B3 domain-containing protein n=1 Tax=Brassica carinata TaxID=52824 RepID=A0A8X7WA82_BRACI|nr:hypothetical protein Bca52824_009671 [Brassica carinata]
MRMTTPGNLISSSLASGFHSGVTIPLEFFSKHIQGSRTLTKGWKEFATAHDLRIGDIVILKHEGDLVFHVTPFGPSGCEIQYTNPHSVKEEADADDAPSFSFDSASWLRSLLQIKGRPPVISSVEAMRLSCFEPTMQRGKTCQQGRKVMDCELGLANRAAYYISERVEKVMP